MMRGAGLVLASLLLAPHVALAAGNAPPASSPFETVPLETTKPRSYLGAYVCMVGGAALIGGSFAIQNKADQTYDRYLVATDPDEIESLYQQTVTYDRWGRATLLTGEALIVAGLYLRFLHHPASRQLQLAVTPQRCAFSVRF